MALSMALFTLALVWARSCAKPSPSPRPRPAPAPSPTPRPTPVPTPCTLVLDTPLEDLLKAEYTSMEDAYDNVQFGHATYGCAARMVDTVQDYSKAEPYLWCVLEHCAECSGAANNAKCPTSTTAAQLHTEAECRSAVWNYLGFVNRKKSTPNYTKAEMYYTTALELWPQNCGALNYLTELYLQTESPVEASTAFASLCSYCTGTEMALLSTSHNLGACETSGAPPRAKSSLLVFVSLVLCCLACLTLGGGNVRLA